ncbi:MULTISPECIES: ATP-binding cassette domain-containing protein [unclassified Treponema]|uniref:ATP-binding cassette domain-containing protein n=1 Tax=unclassified Treponema TaxID=2638727 RepID=UPI0020A61A30|nr:MULTISPECIES: ATP-binding cassette domain-containing protein [unclassified Treponema]
MPRHVLCEYGLRAIHLDSIPVQGSPFIDSVSSAGVKQFTENRQNTEPVQNTLSVVNLSFGYGKTCLFHNLNYTFTSGQVYGIIGMNGTGKTTFAKILCGLIRQKKGTVIFSTKKLSAVKRKRLIYYLANNADSNLFGVSAIEELKLNAPFAELHAVQVLLDEYRLLEKAEAHPFSLSGGQKQRLTLAAAEMLDRGVFILDEPTSGLDAANMRIIAKRTAQLKQQGKIVIIISHDYEFLLASCDTILAMNKTGFTALCPKHDKEKILERMRGETAAN